MFLQPQKMQRLKLNNRTESRVSEKKFDKVKTRPDNRQRLSKIAVIFVGMWCTNKEGIHEVCLVQMLVLCS